MALCCSNATRSWTCWRPRCGVRRTARARSCSSPVRRASARRAWCARSSGPRHRAPTVLQGACDDLLTPRTLGPLRDAARTYGGPLAADPRGRRSGRGAGRGARGTGRGAADRARDRGRPLGRRRDAGRPALRRPPGRRAGRRGRRDVPRRGGRPRPATRAGQPRRPVRCTGSRSPGSPGPRSPSSRAAPPRRPRRCSRSRRATRSSSRRCSRRRRTTSRRRWSTPCSPGCTASRRRPGRRWSSSPWCRRRWSCRWRRALLGDLAVLAEAERGQPARGAAERGRVPPRAGPSSRRGRAAGERAHAAQRPRARASCSPPSSRDLPRVVHYAVEAGDDAAVVAHAPRAAEEAYRAGAHAQEIRFYEELLRRRTLLAPAAEAQILQACATAGSPPTASPTRWTRAPRPWRIRERLGDPAELAAALAGLAPIQWALTRPHEAAGHVANGPSHSWPTTATPRATPGRSATTACC